MTRYINLPSGPSVAVSDEDYEILAKRRWYEQSEPEKQTTYAYTVEYYTCEVLLKRRRRKIFMHRMITECRRGWIVDHWNRNGLCNERWNLRITTVTYNNGNHPPHRDSLSGYRGVSREGSAYRARICFEGVETRLGRYQTAREAAVAYDEAAVRLFGEFAWLNFDPKHDEQRQLTRDLEEIPF